LRRARSALTSGKGDFRGPQVGTLLSSPLVYRTPTETPLFKLLDLFADASVLLNQAALLAGAALFGGIGALLAGNRLYWRFRGRSVQGTVAGVRVSGRLYYPVYRYKSPAGRRFQATSDVAAGVSPKLVTGRKLRLLFLKKHPDRVAEAGVQIVEAVGWGFFALAALAVGIAMTLWPVTPPAWFMLGAVAIFVIYRMRRAMPTRGEKPFTSLTRQPPPEDLVGAPVHAIEEILSGPIRAERQRKQRIAGLIVTPILVAVGIGVFALGAHLGRTTYLLLSTGERAHGAVLFCELVKTLHGSSYYPVVQFATRNGVAVQFRDKMGSNPPPYGEGEAVDVLYFPAVPESSATIDRGVLNWLAPGILCVGGVFLAVVALGARLGVPRHVPEDARRKGSAAKGAAQGTKGSSFR
jgi:hypothetical protein